MFRLARSTLLRCRSLCEIYCACFLCETHYGTNANASDFVWVLLHRGCIRALFVKLSDLAISVFLESAHSIIVAGGCCDRFDMQFAHPIAVHVGDA